MCNISMGLFGNGSVLAGRWKGMVPDVLVLCLIVGFGWSVAQRVHYTVGHDHGSMLQSLYERTGLLLDISILALQIFCKPRKHFSMVLHNLEAGLMNPVSCHWAQLTHGSIIEDQNKMLRRKAILIGSLSKEATSTIAMTRQDL